MEAKRLVGPESGALKYDLLTALSVAGLHGTRTFQTSMLRLIALVTARYNWRQDALTVGQRDMAKMWNVDERTVKREIKRLTQAEVLICTRAGVRGRVGAYRLNHPKIAELSRGSWPSVGPDFVARMEAQVPRPSVVHVDFAKPAPVADTYGPWGRVMATLEQGHPMHFRNWFRQLCFRDFHEGVLEISAPNTFVSSYIESHLTLVLSDAVSQCFGPVRRVVIVQR